jgi:integrase
LWNFFIKKLYTNKNIIESLDPEEKDPAPIPYEDMYTIIKSLREDITYPHHYWIVYFMLLTGCRPSSAIVQEKQDIDFKRKQITIRNIKAGERKNKSYYRFPLYRELELLLKEMKVKQGDTGRLFDMYTVADGNYTWSLSFWKRKIKSLVLSKKISKQYTLKQIRPTLASFLINFLNMDIFSVKKLLDHANIKVTDKYYVDFNVNKTRKDLDAITIEGFLNSEF